jgi:hypothetical protein
MDDPRLDEILRRLDALERKIDAMGSNGCTFRDDERRIVDLIVRLVAERTDRGDRGYSPPPPPEPHHGPRHRR